MHIVIMGCGRVGSTLAHSLEKRGHTVAVIDQNPDAFRRLGPNFVGSTVTGVGFERRTLEEAGIERADAFAAVSSGDNSNIISARLARETFGVQRVVARIYDPRRAAVYERLGIPTVATVRWTSDQVLRSLLPESATEVWRDPSGTVVMIEPPLHPGWLTHKISDLEDATGFRVAYLTRFGVGHLCSQSTVIQEGDRIFLLTTEGQVGKVSEIAGSAPTERNH
ncbi:potassium channel family protein [Cryptosporangium phraense]|uniref:Trk system potassium uptake protein TrkA n=1 Tax=Cryptosporangium phraense TaxID=2593070 RepID=A0A545AIY3_9ACTN|nr:TrkA family potassium uptake protein [Cryptosporangium phraense]TQS41268.1 TrkA family potassium uptake protein [Cryptosporangium phraense]